MSEIEVESRQYPVVHQSCDQSRQSQAQAADSRNGLAALSHRAAGPRPLPVTAVLCERCARLSPACLFAVDKVFTLFLRPWKGKML